MNFEFNDKTKELQARLERFMDKHIYPNEKTYADQMDAFRKAGNPWQVPQILEDLKPLAKEEGLWNLFLPESERGGGLSNLEYSSL
jgi:acyl-CoA dehydrogenase